MTKFRKKIFALVLEDYLNHIN